MKPDELKAQRKLAYQKAKAARDADPAYQAIKQKMKEQARERYRRFKGQQKAEKQDLRLKKQQENDQNLAEAFGLIGQLRLLKFDI